MKCIDDLKPVKRKQEATNEPVMEDNLVICLVVYLDWFIFHSLQGDSSPQACILDL